MGYNPDTDCHACLGDGSLSFRGHASGKWVTEECATCGGTGRKTEPEPFNRRDVAFDALIERARTGLVRADLRDRYIAAGLRLDLYKDFAKGVQGKIGGGYRFFLAHISETTTWTLERDKDDAYWVMVAGHDVTFGKPSTSPGLAFVISALCALKLAGPT